MSSLFGQVWLWSLLSFVAGVALTWLVLVRPAKRELADLEERLLTSPRPATGSSSGSSVAPRAEAGDEFDNWHVEASRSLADDVLTPEPPRYEPAAERARFEAPPEPVRYDVTNMKLDQRDSLLEELDDEHRPLSDFEEQHDFPEFDAEPPRSLFERLTPGQDSRETLEPKPRSYQPDDEPELPAETTHLMPAVPAAPVAEVAPRVEEPTAPPEVEVFQPREVWREEPVREVYDEDVDTAGHEEEDEPERRPNSTEETALIPATALAQAIAEVDGEQRRAEEPQPQVWPEHDLTGHFTPVDVESARGELSEPATSPTSSDEAFLNQLSRDDAHRPEARRQPTRDTEAQTEVRPVDPHLVEPHRGDARPGDEVREEEGPRTDVIRAVSDAAPAEPKTGFAEPPREPEPAAVPEPPAFQPAAPEPAAFQPPEPAAHQPAAPEPAQPAVPESAAEPEVAEPPAFEPTFVPQHADQPLPARSDQAAAPKPEPKKDEPARPRSLFEPLEDDDEEPEPDRPRPASASSGNDQPFVPTLSPELLAGNPLPMNPTGLPQRPTRPTGAPRTPPPAPLAPKPITPPPPRPVRPRPVGFSPSTGGRQQAAPGSTRFQGQQEGFNPRSPFGPGSVLPKSDGLAPAPEFQVKATLTGRRYFTNESANFRETRADVWFRTTTDAEKAGFRQAP
ncbi:hypothetical protein ADK67_05605 [Saccharothrix sp. NRRL B-16348]|uniref:sunset domain-containing protein n=1 Tax=Saccharothrix sp. NRRL B-16348 TaxID=1415542 RepID=UPI0006ADAAF3|nr:hypothetical protein [Saccharothrix sp. NRRL B-16348]KOX33802.1 hypothetical protein ADK67_05605 [Saccharothrix sp. NRRL B-16348]